MRRIKTHTLEKLEYFKKYIDAYVVATKRLPLKYYVDAFAGSGKCVLCDEKCKSKGGLLCKKCGKGKLVDGSALISLKTKNAFSGYLFLDLDKNNSEELNEFIKELDEERKEKVKIKNSDSNCVLKDLHKFIPQYAGCLMFLDPEGPELEWETIKCLSKINKLDLLILYTYDMSLVRLVPNYKEKLDKFYGNPEWKEIYYDKSNFNAEKRRMALLDFYTDNLKQLGFQYVEYKPIRKGIRKGKQLYHLILASHSPVAGKIMRNIFDKELDGQQKMKFESQNTQPSVQMARV